MKRKNYDAIIICRHGTIAKMFWHGRLFLLLCLVTGPSFITISISSLVLELWQYLFIRDLTRNLQIGNTLVWVLSNIRGLGQLNETKFSIKSQIKSYFYRFLVINAQPTRREKNTLLPMQFTLPPPPHTHTHTRTQNLGKLVLRKLYLEGNVFNKINYLSKSYFQNKVFVKLR